MVDFYYKLELEALMIFTLLLLLSIGFYIGELEPSWKKICFDLNCDLFLEKKNSEYFG